MGGKNLVTNVDPSRWATDSFTHPDKKHAGTSYTFAAGMLQGIDEFDAAFFGISPREAAQMDPQQRLLLEMSWEALENAGTRPSTIRGTRCGVFIGISSADYGLRFLDDLGAVDASVPTGNTSCIAANRISYLLDLQGPSMSIDTACSSSLVAFHQACQSIATGEATMALTGGVSLLLHPYAFVAFSKASMLSRKGRCSVFDAAADGYVRSEGGGIFVLKAYDQALADGDPILAVVAGSLVNTDGKKSGLTVPSKVAQATLLTQAYAQAGIAPNEVSYIEAHGTGTPVGDPIETGALATALSQRRPKGQPLLIGSVKSNLGHLEAASGVAGLVKALYCLRHRAIPASIHFENPNPNIPFDEWNLKVVSENTDLPSTGRLIVGINSFGFGGANAHVILESHDDAATARKTTPRPGPIDVPLVLSGKTEAALRANARHYADLLRQSPAEHWYDLAYSAAHHRDWHEYRAVILGSAPQEVAATLASFADGQPGPIPLVHTTSMTSPPRLALIYSGNGSQWEGMGRQLLLESGHFRSAVREIEHLFAQYQDFSLTKELNGDYGSGRYARTEIAQPALFAIQVGVTQMLRAHGMRPAAVAGHSVGEVAAAWAAGALTLEQAVQVIFYRSHFQGLTQGRGQMTAVALGASAMQQLLTETGLCERIAVAGINSARGITLAGPSEALTQLEAILSERQIQCKRLDLNYAFHSPAMDPIQTGLIDALSQLKPQPTQLDFVSTVTGELTPGTQLDARYWWNNIRQPVLFEKAVGTLRHDGIDVFLEVGPHAVLRGYLLECLKAEASPGRVITTLIRGDDSPQRVWHAYAELMLAGATVDLARLFPHAGRFTPLPNYPWQRQRHWQTVTTESLQLIQRRKVHPLLGYRVGQHQPIWENQIDPLVCPELADHQVDGAIVFPGAGYAEMGLAAAAQWTGPQGLPVQLEIEELDIKMMLGLSTDSTKLMRVSLEPSDGSFTIASHTQFSADAWTTHATGRVRTEPTDTLFAQETIQLPTRQPDFDTCSHAAAIARMGLRYGPTFQAIDRGWVQGQMAWARLNAPSAPSSPLAQQALLHPALLDCSFQLLLHILNGLAELPDGLTYLPAKIGRLSLRTALGPPVMTQAQLVQHSMHSLTAHFTLFNAQGEVVAWLRNVRFRAVFIGKKASDAMCLMQYVAQAKPHPQTPVSVPPALAEQLQYAMASPAQAQDGDGGAGLAYEQEVEPLLAALCSSFAVEAFIQLAGPGHYLSESSLAQLFEPHTDAAAMWDRLLTILQQDQLLERRDGGWQLRDTTDSPPSQDIWRILLADHPEHFAATNAVSRLGLNLQAVIQGRATLSQLLPVDCTRASMAAHSLGIGQRHPLLQALSNAVQAGLNQLSEGQRLHLVEISNGSPSVAPALLRSLATERFQATFATLDAENLAQCLHRAESWPALTLLEADPADRTAVQATAQLIVVHNDFSTPQAALSALDWARRRLAPGGTLVWLNTPAARWLEWLFGPQTAWHAGPAHWQAQLEQRGLQTCGQLLLAPGSPSSPNAWLGQSASPPAQTAQSSAAGSVWLILANQDVDGGPMADQLATRLSTLGARVVLSPPALDFSQVEALSAWLSQTTAQLGPVQGILHLHGLPPAGWGPNTQAGVKPEAQLAMQLQRSTVATTVLQACEATHTTTTFWIVTAGAASNWLPGRTAHFGHTLDAPLYGLGRTLLNEPSCLQIRLIDLEPTGVDEPTGEAVFQALLTELIAPDAEREVIFSRTGERFVPRLRVAPRLLPLPPTTGGATRVHLSFSTAGQLRHLGWTTSPSIAPTADEVQIQVHATGLNFRDVMYALGMLSEEAVESGFAGPTLGLECAGIVTALGPEARGLAIGDRVLAFGASCFANQVCTRRSAVARLPSAMGFEAAATIPTTFFTAYYALHHLARLQPGERVLIHGAAGGVGIAAIQLAQHLGAEVFATAGSDEKRDFLRLLGADHIFDSRSLAFADQIMQVTQGQGVDVVLNSLAGEAINRNLGVLKPFGRFLELGKRDFYDNTKVGLRPFRNNIAYFGIDADQLMLAHPALTEALFQQVLDLFAQGILHPLPFQAFEADEVVDAFRQMQQARHIGKIVLTYRQGINQIQPTTRTRAPWHLNPNATYLVTGGLGGFGLKTAQWLADKGARFLVLIGRRDPVAAHAVAAIAALEHQGVTVLAQSCDVTSGPAIAALMAQLNEHMPPLRGVVHAATVIEDSLLRNTSPAQLAKVYAPKILGARHLHEATQHMPLDFFVLFSSATTLFGNPGQGAYVAANAYLEALVKARRAVGLAALSVRWGAVDDVGFLARHKKVRDALQNRMGGAALASDHYLAVLEELLATNRSDLGVMALDWGSLSRFLPSANEPKFERLATLAQGPHTAPIQQSDLHSLLDQLDETSLDITVKDMLKAAVGEILRIPPDKIDLDRSIYDLGLDSLMGVELGLAIEGRLGVQFSVMALSENPTISKLAGKLIAQARQARASTLSEDEQSAALITAQVQQVVEQHAIVVDAQSIERLATDIHSGQATPPARITQS